MTDKNNKTKRKIDDTIENESVAEAINDIVKEDTLTTPPPTGGTKSS